MCNYTAICICLYIFLFAIPILGGGGKGLPPPTPQRYSILNTGQRSAKVKCKVPTGLFARLCATHPPNGIRRIPSRPPKTPNALREGPTWSPLVLGRMATHTKHLFCPNELMHLSEQTVEMRTESWLPRYLLLCACGEAFPT